MCWKGDEDETCIYIYQENRPQISSIKPFLYKPGIKDSSYRVDLCYNNEIKLDNFAIQHFVFSKSLLYMKNHGMVSRVSIPD
jgi:hypothetical protein